MAREAEMKVYLIGSTSEAERVVGVAIRRCYSNKPVLELMEQIPAEKIAELIRMVRSVNHVSTEEHATYSFGIEGISRAIAQQLTRHRLASFSMESQRYVDLSKEELQYVMPPKIRRDPKMAEIFQRQMDVAEQTYRDLIAMGVEPEDARGSLPMNTETKLVVTMNARELGEVFFTQRLCRRSQWEIQDMARAMAKLVIPTAPHQFENVGPTCKTQGICWEGKKSCNLWQTIEGGEVRVRAKHRFKPGIRNDLSFLDEI